MLRAEAVVITCSFCGAKPGKPCTKVDGNRRRPISWLHAARELAADHLHPVENPLTDPPPPPRYRPAPPPIDTSPFPAAPPVWTPEQPLRPDPANLPE